eukprot:CAMPEP_0203677486 /NCGR_PEP_ID=MMETSP0090-20130426/28380_1 /ASSEMBLY_ACC=CAM_ASM_001088 /TAXON_ID=426623 /ORGANISM="Chaetoceros affinis, Strain CCMP159" /LENGTH=734 /DNA_ID=CAMNT_0050544389 /DNA_START=287 /DNA_END=2487 /DNA_ORIENTATION=+
MFQIQFIKLLQAVSLLTLIISTQAIHFRHGFHAHVHDRASLSSLERIGAIRGGGGGSGSSGHSAGFGRGRGWTGTSTNHDIVKSKLKSRNGNVLPCSILTNSRCTDNDNDGRRNINLKQTTKTSRLTQVQVPPMVEHEQVREHDLIVIQTLRGGASEVVDDNDRVLVFDSEGGGGGNNTTSAQTVDVDVDVEELSSLDDAGDNTGDANDRGDSDDDDDTAINNEVVSEYDAEDNDINIVETLQSDEEDEDEDEVDESADEAIQHSTTETTSEQTPITETADGEDDDVDDCFHEVNKSFQETIDSKQNEASNLRIQGKQLHDDGDFQSAAQTFQKAASELDFVISIYQENLHDWDSKNVDSDCDNDDDNDNDEHLSHSDLLKLSEERATCRLHEALCHLKNKNYADSIVSCTDVLMDGVQIVPFTEEYHDDGENGDYNDEDRVNSQEHQAVVVRISPNGGGGKTATSSIELSPAVRARAYHRRAKARLALGDTTGALDDARSAAFLGDRNAVALYGKLMRESGSSSSLFGGSSGYDSTDGGGNLFSSTSPLQSLFSGDDNAASSTNTPSSFDMLGSILGGPGNGSNSASPFGAMGGLGSMLSGMNGFGDSSDMGGLGGMDGLAKSVLTSVTKRIDDKSTQEMVCKFLNDMNASQISSLSTMAGVPLSTNTIDRIVGFANGVTPKRLRKTIKLAKRIIFVGNVLRKTLKVIGKYKHLLVVMLLIAWMKSAILRPVV